VGEKGQVFKTHHQELITQSFCQKERKYMKHLRNLIYLLIIMTLLAAPLVYLPQPVAAQEEYTCLPTCEEDDARFLSVAGIGLSTVADQPIIVTFGSPADSAEMEIGIFDGDTGGQWDFGTSELRFTLYADPELTGDTSTVILTGMGGAMPDNDWATFNITNVPEARSPSGNYFYRLEVGPIVPLQRYWSNFKVRTNAVEMLVAQPFSYLASMLTDADRLVVYPNYPDLSTTTYNGRFDFHIYIPSSVASFAAWEGDFDFGSYDLAFNDTDDPDTPNDIKPSWAEPLITNFEGVAIGANGTTGNPSDDSQFELFRRSPSVIYDVILPDGRTFTNLNPSGNVEWEQYLITSNPAVVSDVLIPGRIPSGLYNIHSLGVDLSNLNAWKFPYQVIGVCPLLPPDTDADPCKPPLFPYLIGDTVFRDPNGNGVQEPEQGEVGIPGVIVYLLDSSGLPVNDINGVPIFTVTDENGMYFFNVPGRTVDLYTGEVIVDGIYSVQVGDENFATGGPLAGMTSTTGGQLLTRQVIDDNVLTYDFGYRVPPSDACVVTPGIWKTRWKDKWPVESITVAGITYTREEAILIMSRPTKYDMTYQLFSQVVAAKLNILNGNESKCIDAAVEYAETWLIDHPLGSGVLIGSPAWIEIMYTFKDLDAYNKGKLCAPACVLEPLPPTNLPPKSPKYVR
jgi:hypothetical protein